MISKEQKQVRGREAGRRVFQAEGTAWTTVIMEYMESSGNMSRVVQFRRSTIHTLGKARNGAMKAEGF